MGAAEAIVNGFKDLVLEKPYGKITVYEICEHAGVSRKTFYAHFDNKYDIVKKLIYDDVISPLMEMNAILPSLMGNKAVLDNLPVILNTSIYNAVYENRELYSRLCCRPGSMDSPLINALIDNITVLNQRALDTVNYKGPQWKRDYISYYYAAGNAVNIQRWLRAGCRVAAEEMGQLYSDMTTPYWRDLAGVD